MNYIKDKEANITTGTGSLFTGNIVIFLLQDLISCLH